MVLSDKDIPKKIADRKKDHIDLTFKTQGLETDTRFDYEPVLATPPQEVEFPKFSLAGKTLRLPIWVSSMTGGTKRAAIINRRLARLAANFGLGMGLGSCRPLLWGHASLGDFDLRPLLGDDVPFFANLGIAQVEQLIASDHLGRLVDLVSLLKADGLIVHVNPLQEWLQPEGDTINTTPIETIKYLVENTTIPIIVKEVGQGMGPQSLRALMQLPLEAIEFGAHGGTNFAKMEMMRSQSTDIHRHKGIMHLGHTAVEMVGFANNILKNEQVACKHFIISGGIKNYLDGYYLIEKLQAPSIYGQASALLALALESYDKLHAYIESQKHGLHLCYQLLRVK